MPRRLRIKLITGLSCAIFGLLVAHVITPTVAYFAAPRVILDGGSLFGDSGDTTQLTRQMAGIQHLNQVITVMTIFGFGVTVVSVLYSFVIFAIWFVGPPEIGGHIQDPQ
jgi:hypothetical protein